MGVAKKHHYLPEFHLRSFCPAGDLWVHDRGKDERRKLRPETAAIRKGFYTAETLDGGKDREEIERRLGIVENYAAPVIRKLDAGGWPELRERYALSVFVALLKYRTLAFERQSAEIRLALADPEVAKEKLAPSVGKVQAILKDSGYDGLELPELAREVYERIRKEGVQPLPGPNARLEWMLSGARELGKELCLLPWTLARPPEGRPFITADDPFAVVATAGIRHPLDFESPGIVAPGYETWIPLSRRSLLIIGHEALDGRSIRFHESEVHAVNVMMAAQCERFFMSGDEAQLTRVARELPPDVGSGFGLPERVDLSRYYGPDGAGRHEI